MPLMNTNASPKDLAPCIEDRQAEGLYYFTREEAIQSLKVTEEAFRKATSRLAKRTRIVNIRSGFFIIVSLGWAPLVKIEHYHVGAMKILESQE